MRKIIFKLTPIFNDLSLNGIPVNGSRNAKHLLLKVLNDKGIFVEHHDEDITRLKEINNLYRWVEGIVDEQLLGIPAYSYAKLHHIGGGFFHLVLV